MTKDRAVRPLSTTEERTWRALIRLMVHLPRAIDEDLLRRSGLSLTRYVVLMRLSEVPDQALRMSELADAASISPSRMTRVVQSMCSEGLVAQHEDHQDRRASFARLTPAGLKRLRQVWPEHLAGARALVLDHIDHTETAAFTRVIERLVDSLEAPAKT